MRHKLNQRPSTIQQRLMHGRHRTVRCRQVGLNFLGRLRARHTSPGERHRNTRLEPPRRRRHRECRRPSRMITTADARTAPLVIHVPVAASFVRDVLTDRRRRRQNLRQLVRRADTRFDRRRLRVPIALRLHPRTVRPPTDAYPTRRAIQSSNPVTGTPTPPARPLRRPGRHLDRTPHPLRRQRLPHHPAVRLPRRERLHTDLRRPHIHRQTHRSPRPRIRRHRRTDISDHRRHTLTGQARRHNPARIALPRIRRIHPHHRRHRPSRSHRQPPPLQPRRLHQTALRRRRNTLIQRMPRPLPDVRRIAA